MKLHEQFIKVLEVINSTSQGSWPISIKLGTNDPSI
jgi:hypothetical protein